MERFILLHGDVLSSLLAESPADAREQYIHEAGYASIEAAEVVLGEGLDLQVVSLTSYMEDAGYDVKPREDEGIYVRHRETGDCALLLDENDPLDTTTWLTDDGSSCPSAWDADEDEDEDEDEGRDFKVYLKNEFSHFPPEDGDEYLFKINSDSYSECREHFLSLTETDPTITLDQVYFVPVDGDEVEDDRFEFES